LAFEVNPRNPGLKPLKPLTVTKFGSLNSGSQVLSRLKKTGRHFQPDGDFAGSERFL
jgi:hypothetical protein